MIKKQTLNIYFASILLQQNETHSFSRQFISNRNFSFRTEGNKTQSKTKLKNNWISVPSYFNVKWSNFTFFKNKINSVKILCAGKAKRKFCSCADDEKKKHFFGFYQ